MNTILKTKMTNADARRVSCALHEQLRRLGYLKGNQTTAAARRIREVWNKMARADENDDRYSFSSSTPVEIIANLFPNLNVFLHRFLLAAAGRAPDA